MTGEDEATAAQDLEAAGFEVRALDRETTDESEDGLVVGRTPPWTERLRRGRE